MPECKLIKTNTFFRHVYLLETRLGPVRSKVVLNELAEALGRLRMLPWRGIDVRLANRWCAVYECRFSESYVLTFTRRNQRVGNRMERWIYLRTIQRL